jgi:hypothetical protein
LGNGTFDDNVIDLPIVVSLLPLGIEIGVGASVIIRIVPWVGKLLVYCGGSWICSGGGGGRLGSSFICGLTLFGIGYMICGTGRGYTIYGVDEG